MKQYLNMLQHILHNGEEKYDRTGTGTVSVFGYQTKYDLIEGFPAVTTKKLWFKGIVYELLWILSGNTNIQYLVQNGVNIWNDDSYRHYLKKMKNGGLSELILTKEEFVERIKNNKDMVQRKPNCPTSVTLGDMGPIYGTQFRHISHFDCDGNSFKFDQLSELIRNLKKDPWSRRHIINCWNTPHINDMALPPCHALVQFYVSNDHRLSCQMYQRSMDAFLGAPYNIASYSLLTHMIARECGYDVGTFVHSIGDAHIYKNHIDQVKEQLEREPMELPKLWLNPDVNKVLDFTYEDIKLIDYKSHGTIKAPLSVGL